MQRLTKFRAWDKIANKMYSPKSFKRRHYGLNYQTDSVELSFSGMEHAEQVLLMQYTGLKDKNGVEIYDGDIAECNYCTKHNLQIVYDAPQFRLKSVGGEACDNAHLIRINTWLKVIGNIYENPELLEANQ